MTSVVRKVCDVLKVVTFGGGVTYAQPRLRHLLWFDVCLPLITMFATFVTFVSATGALRAFPAIYFRNGGGLQLNQDKSF